ncbi:MAG: polymer-forming cytoskeletal protein [Oscillospiraceae bacterium]|nr:polymer-forming cytoskeletal protein [Oscillospiraceae bacterium]
METSSSKGDVMETIIGESTVFEGCVLSSATLRVDGTVKGEIKSKGSVIIGASGRIVGNVAAKELYIAGNIDGNIVVEERTEFAQGGYLHGDMTTKDLLVEQGAAFDGKCNMKNIEHKTTPAAAQPRIDTKSDGIK